MGSGCSQHYRTLMVQHTQITVPCLSFGRDKVEEAVVSSCAANVAKGYEALEHVIHKLENTDFATSPLA